MFPLSEIQYLIVMFPFLFGCGGDTSFGMSCLSLRDFWRHKLPPTELSAQIMSRYKEWVCNIFNIWFLEYTETISILMKVKVEGAFINILSLKVSTNIHFLFIWYDNESLWC